MKADAARAERDLSARHRTHWPPRLTAIDADWHSNDTVLLEAPRSYQAVVPIEYKSVLAGPIDLNGWQVTVLRRAVNQAAPAFVCQFVHPPRASWAFRLHPIVKIAGELLDHRPLLLTERQLTEFLTVLATGTTHGLTYFDRYAASFRTTSRPNQLAGPCARCGVHVLSGRGLLAERKDSKGWAVVHRGPCGDGLQVHGADSPDFFERLDDELPPPDVWPEVTALKRYENFEPQFLMRVAKEWLRHTRRTSTSHRGRPLHRSSRPRSPHLERSGASKSTSD